MDAGVPLLAPMGLISLRGVPPPPAGGQRDRLVRRRAPPSIAILIGAGYNCRLVLKWLRLLCVRTRPPIHDSGRTLEEAEAIDDLHWLKDYTGGASLDSSSSFHPEDGRD